MEKPESTEESEAMNNYYAMFCEFLVDLENS